MNSELHVHIRDSVGRFGKEIFIARRVGDKTYVTQPDGSEKEYKYGQDVAPSFTLDEEEYTALQKEMCIDYVPPRKDYLEGKTEAQAEHLKDLRTLLKL